MGKNRQDIVPVTLRDNQNDRRTVTKQSPQKLVARVKTSHSELFIYEEINDGTLKTLLTEMASYETR
ncbi:hypothetical protein GCM10008932_01090 [Alkalibacterium iburiense]|uniref:Transposase n=1 Tax=Alkalibacterium iburiense TaxID=290589 RepID=A0ABP3GU10_9LACT